MQRIYFDHGATTRPDDRVIREMTRFLTMVYGNPSSSHQFGREAREGVEQARRKVAHALGARTEEIVFTSGGSEADYLAVRGAVRALGERKKHIVISAFEHHAILETCHALEREGFAVSLVGVGRDGLIDPAAVEREIRSDTLLVSIMHVNNEIGTVQPIREIAARVKRHAGVLMHTDAVQSFGKVPVDVDELGVDMLSISAHKIYGAKGAGALFIRAGTPWEPVNYGGGQEGARRPGTENVAGLVGLGVAAELAEGHRKLETERTLVLREQLVNAVLQRIPGSRLNGHRERRVPGNANFVFDGVKGAEILAELDRCGIAASGASACAAGNCRPSHVLLAIGLSPAEALSCVRFTLGIDNTSDEVEYCVHRLEAIIGGRRHR